MYDVRAFIEDKNMNADAESDYKKSVGQISTGKYT